MQSRTTITNYNSRGLGWRGGMQHDVSGVESRDLSCSHSEDYARLARPLQGWSVVEEDCSRPLSENPF
eukprot:3639711-Amphidinium_carterae.1